MIFLVIFFSFIPCNEAKIILPELLTKQAVTNIRYLSRDGKFTYYQKRSGSLLFSTNYKVQEVLKGKIGTDYSVFASFAHKKMVIVQNPNLHNFYSLRAKLNIFFVNYGDVVPHEVGLGIAPTLLLEDSWISYYDPYLKILNFQNTTNVALKFSIKLNNKINPYFIPHVVMSDENTVYYTDLNELGIVGVLEYKRNTSASTIVYKAPSPLMKAEICLHQGRFVLGTFGTRFSRLGSTISSAALPVQDFSKRENLYTSELNDLGHLVCDYDQNNIAFIKNTGNINLPSYDIANLNTSNKVVSAMSELKTVTNIVNMDGILLTQDKGKYFVVKGDVDYKSVDMLKSKSVDESKVKIELTPQENEGTIEAVEEELDNQ
jgi:hypothetical protein